MSYGFGGIDKKVLAILSIIVVAIVLAMSLTPGITGSFLRGETKDIIEPITVDQKPAVNVTPAEPNCTFVKEEYEEMEPYTEEQCVNVPTVNTTCNTTPLVYSLTKECYWSSDLMTLNAKCTLKNLDSDKGVFSANIGVITRDSIFGDNKTIELNPLTSADFAFSYNTSIGNCFCNEVTIPTKQICIDKIYDQKQCFDVTKYRSTIKTREIKKCD